MDTQQKLTKEGSTSSPDLEIRRAELEWEKSKFRTKLYGLVGFLISFSIVIAYSVAYLADAGYRSDEFEFLAHRLRRDILINEENQNSLREKIAELEVRQRNSENLIKSTREAYVETQQLVDALAERAERDMAHIREIVSDTHMQTQVLLEEIERSREN